MKNLILLPLLFLFVTSFAQEKETINWMTWQEATAQQAKDLKAYNETKNNDLRPKKFFLDVYTDWCGWCKKMDASTFMDPTIVAYMNKYFYPVKLDAEMSDTITFNGHEFVNPNPKTGKGRAGTHQFAASILDYQMSYPSYVMLDENVSRTVIYKGYKSAEDLLGVLLFFGKNQHIPYQQGLEKQYKAQTDAALKKPASK